MKAASVKSVLGALIAATPYHTASRLKVPSSLPSYAASNLKIPSSSPQGMQLQDCTKKLQNRSQLRLTSTGMEAQEFLSRDLGTETMPAISGSVDHFLKSMFSCMYLFSVCLFMCVCVYSCVYICALYIYIYVCLFIQWLVCISYMQVSK